MYPIYYKTERALQIQHHIEGIIERTPLVAIAIHHLREEGKAYRMADDVDTAEQFYQAANDLERSLREPAS